MAGLKLGIVRLGRAAGKMKYALLDERDISLVENHAFEARVDVEKNGDGAHVYAYTFEISHGRGAGQYLHELLWEKHCGGIAPGFKVIHKNGISVDNRMENLSLLPEDAKVVQTDGEPCNKFGKEQSLYWIAVQHLHIDPVHEHFPEPPVNTYFNCNGDLIDYEVPITESGCVYYECHYPPCTNMEKRVREFSICGRCQAVRYCGAFCQQQDWTVHKQYCREGLRQTIDDVLPDR